VCRDSPRQSYKINTRFDALVHCSEGQPARAMQRFHSLETRANPCTAHRMIPSQFIQDRHGVYDQREGGRREGPRGTMDTEQ
jgi:hypothetical protein